MTHSLNRGKLIGVSNNSGVSISTRIHTKLRAFGVKRIEIDFRKEEVVFIFEGTYVIVLNIFLTVKWAYKTTPLLILNVNTI